MPDDLRDFLDDMDSAERAVDGAARVLRGAAVANVLEEAAQATPVLSGRLRSRWRADIGGFPGSVTVPEPVVSGAPPTGAERSKIDQSRAFAEAAPDSAEVVVANGEPYASDVIDGLDAALGRAEANAAAEAERRVAAVFGTL